MQQFAHASHKRFDERKYQLPLTSRCGPSFHYAPRPQHYVTAAAWDGYDDKPKTMSGANFGRSKRQCWELVERVVVQLLGLMMLRISRGAFFARGDVPHFVNAKRKMPNGEASTRRCAKRLPYRFSQSVGARFCSSLTTAHGSVMNCRCLQVADVCQLRRW